MRFPAFLNLALAAGCALALSGCTAGFNNNEVLEEALSITEAPTYDFGSQTVGRTQTKSVTLTNEATFILYLLDLTPEKIKLLNGFNLTGGTCTTTAQLNTGESCTLDLSFTPTEKGATSEALVIGFSDDFTQATTTLALRGTAILPAQITISDSPSFHFGTKAVTTQTTHVFTLTNAGESPAVFNTLSTEWLSLSGPLKRGSDGATCATGGILQPGSTCLLPILFAPTQVGTVTQTLNVNYYDNANSVVATLTLTGTASSGAILELSGSEPFSFGDVAIGATSTQALTLSNTGTSPATLRTIGTTELGLSAPLTLAATSCLSSTQLTAGSSCVLSIAYTPTSTGSVSQLLELFYEDGAGQNSVAKTLTGRSATKALITIAPSGTHDYGTKTVGVTASKSFLLTNTGGTAATLGTLSSAALSLSAPFSLSGGNCSSGTTLGPATGSCTIIIDYSPSAATSTTQALTLTYSDGITQAAVTNFSVKGTGQFAANLIITDSPSYHFGEKTVTTTTLQTFTITNNGSLSATLGSVNTSGNLNLSAPYTRTGGSCSDGLTLATSGGSSWCTLTIAYSPVTSGNSNATLSISYNDGVSLVSLTQPLGGYGLSRASLSASPAGMDFGTQVLTTITSSTLSISNSGASTATFGTLDDTGLSLIAPFSKSSGSCSSAGTLAGGAACTLILQYTPSNAVTSTRTFTVNASDSAGAISSTATLTGTGVNPALLTLSDSGTYDFGNVTVSSSSSQTFTLTNSGGVSATLGTISTAGLGLGAPFTLTGGTCATSTVLATSGGGSACTLSVAYSPSTATLSTATLSVAYFDGASNTSAMRPLQGTGLSRASIAFVPSSTYDFGSVTLNTTVSATFTVTNTGQTQATLGTVTTGGLGLAGDYSKTGGTCASSGALAGGGNCTIEVGFLPTTLGASSGALTLTASDVVGAIGSATRAVQGTGTGTAAVTLTPVGSFTFSTTVVNTSTTQTFTLVNGGPAAGTLGDLTTSGLGLSAPFTRTGGTCANNAQSINGSGGTCTVIIEYAPTSAITSEQAISIAYHDGSINTSTVSTLSGSATEVTLSVSPSSLDLGEIANEWSSAALALTVSNTGSAHASGCTRGIGGSHANQFNIKSTSCTGTLNAGSSCIVSIQGVPTSLGVKTSTLGVTCTSPTSKSAATGTDLITATSATPMGAVQVASANSSTCVLLVNGSVKCFGDNSKGRLGLNHTDAVGSSSGSMATLSAINFGAGVRIRQLQTFSNSQSHYCAITDQGDVKCWGENTYGQLGLDHTDDQGDDSGETLTLASVNLGTGRKARQVSVGATGTSCAVLDDFSIKCWGNNDSGVLGQGHTVDIGGSSGQMATLAPINLGTNRTAKQVSVGSSPHACALLENGDVRCWGHNGDGSLGTGDSVSYGSTSGDPVGNSPVINLGRKAIQVASGWYMFCALLDDGSVKCWGAALYPEMLGRETTDSATTSAIIGTMTPVNLGTGRTAKSISVGGSHVCANLDDGSAKCWGKYNSNGKLGQGHANDVGSTANSMATLSPINLGTGATIREINALYTHTCSILDDGTLRCFGDGAAGALGNESTATIGINSGETATIKPVNLGVLRRPTDLTAGSHTCARLNNGDLRCWGYNGYGAVGTDDSNVEYNNAATAPSVTLGAPVRSVAAGQFHTCATLSDGALKCFGRNTEGALGYNHANHLGDGSGEMAALTAITFGTHTNLWQLPKHLGEAHSCALPTTAFGDLFCWGYGYNGLLGVDSAIDYGSSANSMVSVTAALLGTDKVVQSDSRGYHTCAITSSGTLKCWGNNFDGQLGQDSNLQKGSSPGDMAALTAINLGTNKTAVSVAAGTYHTCAILNDGSLKCWGLNDSGQLGQDNTASIGKTPGDMAALTPINLGTGATALEVVAGNDYTCALLVDGTLKCFGNGTYGKLGQDSNTSHGSSGGQMAALNSINLGTGMRAIKVAAGSQHVCALLSDGTVKCWGRGDSGSLGNSNNSAVGPNPGDMASIQAITIK